MNLRLSNVSQSYGSHPVLDKISMELRNGVIGLLGPNGAGKTTLLRTMATIIPPRSGTLVVGGVNVYNERTAQLARSKIGYLPQEFGYEPGMRLVDFLHYAAWIRGVPSSARDQATERALRQVELADRRSMKLRKLSGGMRQRAGIAWALVGEPPVILLDEPTVGLDVRQRLQFRKIISELKSSTVVLSTHLIDDIDAICDEVIVVQGGRLRFAGTTKEMATLGSRNLPGNSDLERAYMKLLPATERVL